MINEKEEKFNIATQKLVKLAGSYDVKIQAEFSFPYLIEKVRELFKSPEIYKEVFGNDKYDLCKGYCCVASYYIMKNTGGNKVWTLMKGFRHWWLLHKESGKIFDVTYDQFPRYYNYSNGVPEIRLEKRTFFKDIIETQSIIFNKNIELELNKLERK